MPPAMLPETHTVIQIIFMVGMVFAQLLFECVIYV